MTKTKIEDPSSPLYQANENASRGSVLLLEDAEPARNVVKFFFEKNNFTVYGFANGQTAFDFIKKKEVIDLKLILSDIMMPEMDGFEFVKLLKESKKFPSVPILIMSALWEKESVLQAKNLGVLGYILKPITIQKLITSLNKVFPNETFKDGSKLNL